MGKRLAYGGILGRFVVVTEAMVPWADAGTFDPFRCICELATLEMARMACVTMTTNPLPEAIHE